jgi:protein-S-isoprenylcysteine O-methyltransferase Ste14
MFVVVRAIAYASLFISLLLIYLPRRILDATGIVRPAVIGPWQIVGGVLCLAGAALAIACILTFVFIGRGTPAPFDPPRKLVVRGPYRVVRNPMYLGATIALTGVAFFYQSWPLCIYAFAFLVATHLFVLIYEEPTLRGLFGREYEDYLHRVGRWWPGFGKTR